MLIKESDDRWIICVCKRGRVKREIERTEKIIYSCTAAGRSLSL